MAKYRDIRTDEVFDNEQEAVDCICDSSMCPKCCIKKYIGDSYCNDYRAVNVFINHYPEFGYEKVEKPRSNLAKALGVEEDQEWYYEDNEAMVYRIHNGKRQFRKGLEWHDNASEEILSKFINDPSKIHIVNKKRNWTEREIEIVKAWKTMNPAIATVFVEKLDDTQIEIDYVVLNEDPTKCPNFFACDRGVIKLSDILGES